LEGSVSYAIALRWRGDLLCDIAVGVEEKEKNATCFCPRGGTEEGGVNR
jgi:hypothetical protein